MIEFIVIILIAYVATVLLLMYCFYLRIWRAAQRAERIEVIAMLSHSASACQRDMRRMNINTHEEQLNLAGMDGAQIALSEFAEALSETLYENRKKSPR